ncbi:hypothetical protein PVAG01_10962 [Phlyctema vagabunda]|uniref:Small ribosomal subunit protein mS29 n=1 Tax=Phlyctema vagabunda TaxID=108571 RepID=A0ABR4P442_9HELO
MASTSCWKCLVRPSVPLPRSTIASSTAAFSTTTPLAANVVKAKPKGQKPSKPSMRSGGSLRIKKKAFVKPSGRPPMPGERKALRKRIVLSNTNALEVPDLVDLNAENLVDPQLVGKVVGLPGPVIDQLRAADAFKITQGWSLFRRPAMLIREESVRVVGLMDQAAAKKETYRVVLDGNRGTGKSMLVLQAMTAAFIKGWVVVNIPECQELTAATTEYTPIPNTNPTQYTQHQYAALLLSQIGKANQAVLSSLILSMKHPDSPIPLQENISLARLAELGARDPEISWELFHIFWREMMVEGRPPMLISMDSVSHLMGESAYRNPEFKLIHAHDLVLVKHFVDHLSGAAKLPNGGAVIGAMSRSHAPKLLAVELALTQQLERQNGQPLSQPQGFKKYDAPSLKALGNGNVQVMKVAGLSRDEARGLMEYWARSGLLRQTVTEKVVAEKWALAGNGVVGEIERGALRMRI